MSSKENIAILIPCYNEAYTIEKVIKDFQNIVPSATIYVFDNNSNDGTAEIAKKAKAEVVLSPRKGKGNVVQHMFNQIDADIYVMVDGDDTYPANELPKMLTHFRKKKQDVVVGMRLNKYDKKAFPLLHKFGNRLISNIISFLFKIKIQDVLSGYRIFSRNFVKTVNLKSQNFEIETEITINSVLYGFKLAEVPIAYYERPKGSISKLNTFRDGMSILKAIFIVMKAYRPGLVYYSLALFAFVLGLVAGYYPIMDYYTDRYVYHVPLAMLAASLEILAAIFFTVGIVLTHISSLHHEMQIVLNKINNYLQNN